MVGKKRLFLAAGTLASIGAVVALATGVTFGLFSASATQTGTNSFSTGDVSIGSPVTVQCTVSNMAPGDQSSGYSPANLGETTTPGTPCSFQVKYTGSLPAYLAVDEVEASTSTPDLYSTGGLKFQISDGTTSYSSAGSLNGSDLLVSSTPDAGGSNAVHKITVNYALPTSADNTFQDTNTTLTLTIHAVQSDNNNFVGSCTAGTTCGTAANWS
jgi:hypothetical protein